MPKRVVLVLLGFLVVAGLVLRASADEDVAKFLLAQAKKAVSARAFDDAVVKLERALEEDPTLLEAAYILGQVFEKRKEPGKALGAYRTFRDGCDAQGESLDKKLKRLLPRALKRIGVLGKGESELEKLEKHFESEILHFASRRKEGDPDIAVDALRRLVLVAPDTKEAQSLLAELTGEADPTAKGGTGGEGCPVPGFDVWKDLLASRAIPPGTNIQYRKKLLEIDQPGGTIFWTDPYVLTPPTFVYEIEFRFRKEHAPGYAVGLVFGRAPKGDAFVMALLQKSNLAVVQASGGRNVDLAETALPSTRLGTWRRLTVAVEGRKTRVFVDGRRLANTSVPGVEDLTGPVGLFHQRSDVEIRMLRLGTKE